MLTSVRKQQKWLTDSFNLSVTYINFTLEIKKKKNKLMLSWNYKFNDLHEKWQGGYSLINCQVAPAFEKWSAKIQAAYQPKASAIPVPRHQQWFIIGGGDSCTKLSVNSLTALCLIMAVKAFTKTTHSKKKTKTKSIKTYDHFYSDDCSWRLFFIFVGLNLSYLQFAPFYFCS